MIELNINGTARSVDADPSTPLLWALRDTLKMTGTKFGCGVAQCGACTVLVDGMAVRSCQQPVEGLVGSEITTIEGVKDKVAEALHAAWVEHQVPQCGYCQSGQIMSATALLTDTPKPTDADIDAAMQGNICRCATYVRIRAAIHTAAGKLGAA